MQLCRTLRILVTYPQALVKVLEQLVSVLSGLLYFPTANLLLKG